jgi:hypothetical protein
MDLFPSSSEGGVGETHAQLGPIERANLKSLDLTLGRKQLQFPERCVFYYLEFRGLSPLVNYTDRETAACRRS